MNIVRAFFLVVFVAALCLLAVLGALFINEHFLMGPPATARDDALRGGVATLELYPYTGFHVRANYHHQGDLPENQPYHNYDIQTGDLGFFDFELDAPYTKEPDEFRILWTGGSGAQGWGARTNGDMMYRLLPKYLNEKIGHCGVTVRLFNFAMGSSKTYQNAIALNLWGQRLEPDMIVSYSGRNDVNVPFRYMNDSYFSFEGVNAYTMMRRPPDADERGLIAWLGRTFPRTFENSYLGTSLRQLFQFERYFNRAVSTYPARTHKGNYPGMYRSRYMSPPEQYFESVIKPDYAHALKTMKRDFSGIPIAVAWQAVTDQEWQDSAIGPLLGEHFYTRWFESLPQELGGYMNKNWYFYDVDSYMKQFPDDNTGTHLGNAGQERVSRYLADKLAPDIIKLRKLSCTPR